MNNQRFGTPYLDAVFNILKQNIMKKKVTHNGQEIIFTIELNAEVERRLNGIRKHRFSAAKLPQGDTFFTTMIEDSGLTFNLLDAENTALEILDKRKSQTVLLLEQNGYCEN